MKSLRTTPPSFIPAETKSFWRSSPAPIYLKRAVQLRYGTTKVSTKTRLALSVYQYTITPTPAPPQETKYEVMWSNAGGRVRVYEGEVRVDGCAKSQTVPADKIAELGRDCKVGAYLRPQGFRPVYALGLAAPAAPIICYYLCLSNLSCPDKNGKFNSPHP